MESTRQLGEDRVLTLLIRFSVPAIIGMMVNALYNVVDRIFVGNYVGALGIAGITIGFPIMLVIFACAMLVGIGSTSLLSIRLGQNKLDEAEKIIGHGLLLLVVLSALISSLGLIFLNPLLRTFGASEAVLPFAREYLSVILFGSVFQTVGFGMNNYIRAEGNPRIAMVTMLVGALTNIALDALFILKFGWGLRGAALATVISQSVAAAWVLYYFLGGNSVLKIRVKNFRLEFSLVAKIAALGFAPFAMQLAGSMLGVLMNRSLSIYGGDLAISAVGIINSIVMLILMPVFGINQAVQPIIGYNYGARQFDRVKEALKLGVIAATVIVTIGYTATRLFPEILMGMFARDERELISFGAHALGIFTTFLPLVGFQIVGSNYFQAVGKPKMSMLLTLSRQVLILVPALLILPRIWGLNGVLVAPPLADILSCALTGLCLFLELRSLHPEKEMVIA